MEEGKKGYLITIEGKNKKRTINLSTSGFNFVVFLAMLAIFVFIGTCSCTVYAILHHKQNAEIIQSVQHSAEMQQEQILTISKKAVNLSETLQNLAQQEQELRIQAGLDKPAKEDKLAAENVPNADEIPELEEIGSIEGLPKPEELPELENIPATVNIPAPNEKANGGWISPSNGGYAGANVQPEIPAQNVEVPAVNSNWNSPENGGYAGTQIETPAQNVEIPTVNSNWNSPDNGGYAGTQTETPAQNVEIPAVNSNWSSPDNGGYTGQGGPLTDLAIKDVSEALEIIEQRVAIRLDSLNDFQTELKVRREQMAIVASIPSNPVGTYSTVVIDNGFSSDLSLDLSQFGGTPANDPNMPSIWPTTGVVTSPYGLRWGGTDFHPGIDIANDLGTPIVATADGIVEYAGWNAGGYGNMVDINHGNGIMTRYGHASQVVVTVGQYVKRGQLIAYMGSTGFSTGPHCHYEVHVSGQRVNPISYL